MRPPEEWIRRAQRGEQVALDALIEGASPVLRRYLERRLGQRLRRFVSVSDLEQEVLMQGLQGLRRLSPEATVDDFHALLFTHARWAVGKAARRNRNAAGESQRSAEPGLPSRSMGSVTRDDEAAWLRRRLGDLPDGQRAVVQRRLQGWTFARIAEDLGLREDAARKRFVAAARELRGTRPSS